MPDHCAPDRAGIHDVELRPDRIGKMHQALVHQPRLALVVLRVNEHPVCHGDRAEMHLKSASELRARVTLHDRQADDYGGLVQEGG